MSVRAQVNPSLVTWARERSGIDAESLVKRFPKLHEWEQGATSPTLKQLEKFAHATHTPVGYLLLASPPEEPVPIPDYRTMGNQGVRRPSPNLLDTIYLCQLRQDWYRSFAQVNQEAPVSFIGTLTTQVGVAEAASRMREFLGFGIDQRGANFTDALRVLSESAEAHGVLVMISGVVGSNTHRKLDSHEFRGFALVDQFAPVVFVNGADTKAAQIFTLAHELAHLWLGETALSDADLGVSAANSIERWCNQVAAEVLVPIARLDEQLRDTPIDAEELDRLARIFKVSSLVILRRIHEAGRLTWDAYRNQYQSELDRVLSILELRGGGEGGNFYNTQPVRVSKRFARAVVGSTLEGQTLYTEAFQLLGFRKTATFNELAERLGLG
jgi:Zn-dependent peptidase ImmA (M78 family)